MKKKYSVLSFPVLYVHFSGTRRTTKLVCGKFLLLNFIKLKEKLWDKVRVHVKRKNIIKNGEPPKWSEVEVLFVDDIVRFVAFHSKTAHRK